MKDDISFHDTQIYVHTVTYIHNILYPHMHAYHYIHYIHFIGYMHDIHQIHCTHYIITQIPLHTMTTIHGLSMRNLRNLSEKCAPHRSAWSATIIAWVRRMLLPRNTSCVRGELDLAGYILPAKPSKRTQNHWIWLVNTNNPWPFLC